MAHFSYLSTYLFSLFREGSVALFFFFHSCPHIFCCLFREGSVTHFIFLLRHFFSNLLLYLAFLQNLTFHFLYYFNPILLFNFFPKSYNPFYITQKKKISFVFLFFRS